MKTKTAWLKQNNEWWFYDFTKLRDTRGLLTRALRTALCPPRQVLPEFCAFELRLG